MLEIKNFSKTYNGKDYAVNNISFEVESGDICAFIGHNGAGKTTTLKAISGIIEISQGEITVDGKSIKEQPIEVKKSIAYIPDNPEVYDFFTGNQFLNFICDIYNVSAEDQKTKIPYYLKKFDMEKCINDSVSTYSHGMKQKLVIISALIHSPRLLLLDEPFVGLDPIATHLLKEIFAEFCKEGGAILFSTHILEVAQKICNKMVLIKNGEIILSGDVKDLTKDKDLEKIFLESNK